MEYERKTLLGIEEELKDLILNIATKSNFEIMKMETDKTISIYLLRVNLNILSSIK
ncbi:MAG: hypothetical protein RBT65_05400 [Methanolobus sp.]|nr:hypothetical protein [Methanolobus sp.]